MSELDDAVVAYVAARKRAQAEYERLRNTDPENASKAYLIEQEAWEIFWPIKQKYSENGG
jgi:hypothetical protein